jgi:hypothetical protein
LPNNVISDCNLPAPTNLQAVEVGPSYATIAWDAVPEATGYLVSWYDESGAQVNSETTLDTEYEVQGLESGKTYNFRVASVCNSGGTGTIYSMVPIVPIIVELLVSSDNPFGNLSMICEKDINPTAECTFNLSSSNNYVGKVRNINTNENYYFEVKYASSNEKGENTLIQLNLVKPQYYPDKPVFRPKLLTETGLPSGLIFLYGDAESFSNKYFEIRIEKIGVDKYVVKLKNVTNKDELEFLFFQKATQIFGKSEYNETLNSENIINKNDEFYVVKNNFNLIIGRESDNNKLFDFSIFDLTGKIIKYKKTCSINDYLDLQDMPSGIYLLNIKNENYTKTIKFLHLNQ